MQSRRFPKGLWFAVAVLLAILITTRPIRAAAAQQPAPAASAQPAADSDEVTERQIEHDEEKGDNFYRHSAMIKAAARVLHLSVETTARSFEAINIAIVVLAIGIPLFRFLPKYLRDRGEKIGSEIEAARKQTEDANSRLSSVEARLAHLDEEIARFRAEIEAEMRQDEVRIKAALEEERARIVASVEQEIGAAAAHARRGLRNFAAELAIENAARQMTITPETDRALIAEFVSDAGKGGKN
ncbi:MAG: ATP synthase F0 subunit B [Terracidiphilus sp.]